MTDKSTHKISPDELEFTRIQQIMREDLDLGLSDRAVELVRKCRRYLDQKLAGCLPMPG